MVMLRCLEIAVLVASSASLSAPPSFVMDLSKPPAARWDGAVAKVLERHPYEYSFDPVFKNHAPLFDALTETQKGAIASAVQRHYPEAAAELGGIAAQFETIGHSEVTFEYLAGWLYFHELAHTDLGEGSQIDTRECTGIVAQTESGGMLHGGNMDQSPPAARNLTLRVRFIDAAGKTVFEGVDWYVLLTTGVSRAVKQGVATVQENWRRTTTRPVEDVMADIELGVVSQMLVFRHFFVAADAAPVTFNDFVTHVSNNRLASPYYIVASGPSPGDGVVIARNLSGAARIDRIADSAARTNSSDYFLVQSNYDRWLDDSTEDPRRTAAELTLRDLGNGEGASMLGLMAVTSTYPVHNPHSAYTALMSAATGELHVYVREALCPVDPDAGIVRDDRYDCTAPPPANVKTWPAWATDVVRGLVTVI